MQLCSSAVLVGEKNPTEWQDEKKINRERVAVEKERQRKLEPINTRACDHFSLLSARDNEKMLLPSVDSVRSVCTFK